MNAGSTSTQIVAIPPNMLWDDYYENLHGAYNSMNGAFRYRVQTDGLIQDDLAIKLDVDKGLISRRLNGTENLTLKTLSFMGTAMECRLSVQFIPYEEVGCSNYFQSTGVFFQPSTRALNVANPPPPEVSNVAKAA